MRYISLVVFRTPLGKQLLLGFFDKPRKEMNVAEMDAINSWKGKMHLSKLLLRKIWKKHLYLDFPADRLSQ